MTEKFVEEGRWMYIPEAMEATGVSERTLRRWLGNGRLRSRKHGKHSNAPIQLWITADLQKDRLDSIPVDGDVDPIISDLAYETLADEESPQPGTAGSAAQSEHGATGSNAYQGEAVDESAEEQARAGSHSGPQAIPGDLNHILRTLTDHFVQKLEAQHDVIFTLRQELTEKEQQLRLLPDLQKQYAEQNQATEFERNALAKQLEELQGENERLKAEKETAEKAAQEALLQAKAKKPWWKSFLGVQEV
jgi:hypothetical protein